MFNYEINDKCFQVHHLEKVISVYMTEYSCSKVNLVDAGGGGGGVMKSIYFYFYINYCLNVSIEIRLNFTVFISRKNVSFSHSAFPFLLNTNLMDISLIENAKPSFRNVKHNNTTNKTEPLSKGSNDNCFKT